MTPLRRTADTRPTEEADRIAIAAALIRSGVYDDDEMDLLQWHPCESTCSRKCGCSGVPYVSDEVWRELGPVIAAIRHRRSLRCCLGLHRWSGSERRGWRCERCGKDAKRCRNCGGQHDPNAYLVVCRVITGGQP